MSEEKKMIVGSTVNAKYDPVAAHWVVGASVNGAIVGGSPAGTPIGMLL
jgi:hypothetical protein